MYEFKSMKNTKVNDIDLFFLLPHDICVPSVCTILYIIYITKFADVLLLTFMLLIADF